MLRLREIKPADFMEPDMFYRMGVPPLMVDILPNVRGIDFEDAWKRRADIVIDPESGLSAHLISRQDLIAAKLAAGRPPSASTSVSAPVLQLPLV